MLHRKRHLLFGLVLCSLLAAPVTARQRDTGFLNRVVKVDGIEYRYQVYVPADWSKNQKWPVILFLHGAGERGKDGLFPSEIGIGNAIRRHAERFPCIVVIPQCRKEGWWTHANMEAQVFTALDQAVKEFQGDTQRLYLTGLSMGGYGTWAFGAKYPGKFAALVPICGGVRLPPRARERLKLTVPEEPADVYNVTAQKVGKTPVWVFHGGADPVVPVTESRELVAALKAAGAEVRYTEYEGVGHDSWTKAYDDAELLTWLFSQRLNASANAR